MLELHHEPRILTPHHMSYALLSPKYKLTSMQLSVWSWVTATYIFITSAVLILSLILTLCVSLFPQVLDVSLILKKYNTHLLLVERLI